MRKDVRYVVHSQESMFTSTRPSFRNFHYLFFPFIELSLFKRNGQICMDMTITNKAMQPMSGFAIQLNKNRYTVFNFNLVLRK